MQRVFLVAGVLIVCLLVVGGWFFIGGIGGWSQLLGQKSSEAVEEETSSFIGVWYGGPTVGSISFFSDGTYRKGVFEGPWALDLDDLLLYGLEGKNTWTAYQYTFFDEGSRLVLTDVQSREKIDLIRQ